MFDAYGFYYLRRGKSSAALDYVQKAMRAHAHMQVTGSLAQCKVYVEQYFPIERESFLRIELSLMVRVGLVFLPAR